MKRVSFNEVAIGDQFFSNYTLYRKQSSRTACMLDGSWFYFGQQEVVQI